MTLLSMHVSKRCLIILSHIYLVYRNKRPSKQVLFRYFTFCFLFFVILLAKLNFLVLPPQIAFK